MTNYEKFVSTPEKIAMFLVEIDRALDKEALRISRDLGESYIGVNPPIDVLIDSVTRGSSPKYISSYAIIEWLQEEAE